MNVPLRSVIWFKIVVTAIVWCPPLLLMPWPRTWYAGLRFPVPTPLVFVHLLGAAYLALIVAYYMGLREINRGASPTPVRCLGLVSNGAAALFIFSAGLANEWSAWGIWAQAYMWTSGFLATLITVLLLLARQPTVDPV